MKIQRGYKLFEQDAAGNLYALFIDKKTIMPLGEWLKANSYPTKGFAVRPGYHIGAEVPSAPWLMSHNGTYTSQRNKQWKRVWAEVEYVANVDYTPIVAQLPKKCFTDQLPENGFYQFRETNNRIWIITDKMRITKILTEEERKEILNQMNYDEVAAFEPYRKAIVKRMKRV